MGDWIFFNIVMPFLVFDLYHSSTFVEVATTVASHILWDPGWLSFRFLFILLETDLVSRLIFLSGSCQYYLEDRGQRNILLLRTEVYEVGLSPFDSCNSAVTQLIWGNLASICVSIERVLYYVVPLLAAFATPIASDRKMFVFEQHHGRTHTQPLLLSFLRTGGVRFMKTSWYYLLHSSHCMPLSTGYQHNGSWKLISIDCPVTNRRYLKETRHKRNPETRGSDDQKIVNW